MQIFALVLAAFFSAVRDHNGRVTVENADGIRPAVEMTAPLTGTLYAQLVDEGTVAKTNDFGAVAELVEKTTGERIGGLIERRILGPIGVTGLKEDGGRLMLPITGAEKFTRMLADAGRTTEGETVISFNALKTLRRKQTSALAADFLSYGVVPAESGRTIRFGSGEFLAEADPDNGAYRVWYGPAEKRAVTWKRANPVRTAVFVGIGPMGQSSTELVRYVARSPELDFRAVDAEDIRNGALRGVDLLVMPGGGSAHILEDLGRKEGFEEVKRFIREGGSYIGICAGAVILLSDPTRPANGMGIVPFERLGSSGADAMTSLKLTESGAKALGMDRNEFECWYSGGPFMKALDPTGWPGMKMEPWGEYARNVEDEDGRGQKMKGTVAIIGGGYGKGKMAVCACHPEFHHSSDRLVEGMFRYCTGREVTFPEPKVNRGAKKVAFYSWPVAGKGFAELLTELDADPGIELVTIERHEIIRGELKDFDAFVISDGSDWALSYDMFPKEAEEEIAKYAANGGKVYAWGANARHLPKGGIACRSGYEVYARIKD